ncbi:uncharacterized protein LOC130212098 [Pseudoliparis swirei]|uniref:uncharacterized protein LOC130212098 n=1 Tax=Pseudoliparis swirei TaxID=2059687 RepID=UPI0024BDB61E|nr:uncharacterized protein LOC130212098 [Pseudoliparis swirei]
MSAVFNLLLQHRLDSFYKTFLELGVKDERDFIDVTEDDLNKVGMSQVERNRFTALKKAVGRLRAPAAATPVKKSLESYCLQYTFPKCPEPRSINDMDPAQNSVEDLMLRICHLECENPSKSVCLYTVDGMPLTDDPFFNTWSLNDRHIKNGDVIYAIFTPKKNLRAPKVSMREVLESLGSDTVRCHVMLKGDFEVTVDLAIDTIGSLKNKLASESGIPRNVLHYNGECDSGDSLEVCGISKASTVYFSLSTFAEEAPGHADFFMDDVEPSVQQTSKGLSVFLSSLYLIKHKGLGVPDRDLIGYIRKLTGCHPLAQSLHQLIERNQIISWNQKIAVVEGLYMLFRELLPQLGKKHGEKIIEDADVFEYSTYCWAYLLSEAKKETSAHDNYAPISLISDEARRFCDPVTVTGIPGVFERAVLLQKIKDGEKIPNCPEKVLSEMLLNRATDVEKILLSVHPSMKTYDLWIFHDYVAGQNFHMNTSKTFGDMAEELKAFPQLNVAPPLRLKDFGVDDGQLVYLSEDNLGVYLGKDKACPAQLKVYNCMTGKTQNVDVDALAALTGDQRDDFSFVTTRTPKEAILVLIDTSSSMTEKCYGDLEMQKIHAVKELFDNFATRTMAYDFHHVIGLVKFDSTVKTLHTFTETLEKFKEHVHSLQANGRTTLYDALHHGALELENAKKFPDCKLRILCLTDGNDVGSVNKPEVVVANLIKSNIIVDSILLGKVENNILRGISKATGGCCFKPETSKDGLKLFEIETVLSLEMRKPKNKADPSSITLSFLTTTGACHGYDEFPEAVLPSQMHSKVTGTDSALKKKIRDAKLRPLMEKDKRILQELRSLHCDPHPYFSIFPSESDFTFWKILMEGPPDTPYERGTFELFCQFGSDYPVKPPLVRFVTRVYHCNINSVGRICHNIFDRNYHAQITMRDVLNAVYGLLIIPEPEDPLDSILAEEFLTSPKTYEQEAQKHTEGTAAQSMDDMEKKLVDPEKQFTPQHLICPLTKKMFVDPVKTRNGTVYERKAIEKHLKTSKSDPKGPESLTKADLKPATDMKKMVTEQRHRQIQGE